MRMLSELVSLFVQAPGLFVLLGIFTFIIMVFVCDFLLQMARILKGQGTCKGDPK